MILTKEKIGSQFRNFEEGESNLMQMGVRMYSARIGRFLSVDPLHEIMPQHNPYHYAFNSPLVWKDPSGLAPEKDKNIHSEKLQGQLIKLRDLSNPIMPGDEYWIYIKDDRDFYFSAEYDAGFYTNGLWPTYLPSTGYGGGGGGGSGGSTSESERSGISGGGNSGSFFGWLWDGITNAVDAITGVFSSSDLTEEEINAKDYGVIAEVEVFGEKEQVLPEATWWDFILNGGWNRTADIGGNEYIIDAKGYSTGMPAPILLTAPDVTPGVVGKIKKVKDVTQTFEKMGKAIGKMSSNRIVQKQQIESLITRFGLNKIERNKLHKYIHGQGYGFKEIEEIIKNGWYK